MEPKAMAQNNLLGRGRHGQISHVRTRLTNAHDHDRLVNTKLRPSLELRRVQADGNLFHAGDMGNVGGNMQTAADGDGIRLVLAHLTSLCVAVFDDMLFTLERGLSGDGVHLGIERDVRADLEVVAVVVEVLEVPGDGQEVGLVIGKTEV